MNAIARTGEDATLDEAVARLTARYREIATTSMADVPICNRCLSVEALGFQRHKGRALGMVVTPWFMNLVAFDLPDGARGPEAAMGASTPMALPAGQVELIVGDLPGFGRVDMCSLFSPMFEFADMAAAVETARLALTELLTPPAPPPPKAKPALDRRAFLRGALGAREEAPA